MKQKNEQRFYSALKDVFVGEKVEGESGYVNLMKIKNEYFEKIKPFIENEINETIADDSAREELFEKLYTFFESYFSDTGTPFFDKTQLHKNLYEKVYTERDDVSLFWKTQKLYYVKSEANYTSMDLPDIDGFKCVFDASEIEHQKSNEKKSLEFYLTDTEENKLTFKVRYVDNTRSKWDRLKNYLNQNTPAKVRKHIAENLDDIEHGSINVISNSLDRTDLRPKFIEDNIIIKNNDDSIQSVDVEFAVSKLNNLETYFAKSNIIIDIATVKKAFTIYKKQNEVDYFIHKDAEGFLKEQFDIYLYNYLFGEGGLESEWQQDRINDIQNIKKIAHTVIEYIARFEDELKAIWEKPKFVRNSNYVFTLDRIKDNVELIEKIINHEGFEKQVEEWKRLHEQWYDENGNEIKKKWNEFKFSIDFNRNKVLLDNQIIKELNTKYKHLPIDTFYFKNMEQDILDEFDSLDSNLDGLLIKSENFQALLTTKPKYKRKIQTIYIDPPFNLGKNPDYLYKVNYKDSTWLTMLENRISVSKDFLGEMGNFFLRCDYNGNYIARFVLNNVFGNQNYLNEILVGKTPGKSKSGLTLSYTKDNLFFYSNKGKTVVNVLSAINEKYKFYTEVYKKLQKYELENIEQVRKRIEDSIFWVDLDHRPGERINKRERVLLDITFLPPKGRHWIKSQQRLNDLQTNGKARVLDKLTGKVFYNKDDLNNIDLSKTKPVIQIFLDDKVVTDNWTDISGYSQSHKFQTENSELLLKRVIKTASNKEDIILDFFNGSATTSATAHKLCRKWIGIEIGEHFFSHNVPRMKKVLAGDQSGISKDNDVKWKGCGFFKYYELEQFEDALRLAKYNPKDDDLANVNFQKDEKLLDAVEIDRENENVKIHFETLYPDVDIAETLSNLLGKKIKKLNNERVVFEDDMEIIFDEMTYENYPWVKPLIWWKSKG